MKYNNIKGIELWQFNEIIRELECYDDEVYSMDDFDDVFSLEGLEAIQAAFYGGRFGYLQGQFNPNDEYFLINGYGNVVSLPHCYAQKYFDQFENEILEYVNENEIELYGVEEDDDE